MSRVRWMGIFAITLKSLRNRTPGISCSYKLMIKRKRYLPVITKPERLHALDNQIHRLHRRIDALNQRSNRLSWVRLAIFLPGFFLAILVFFLAGWPWSLAIAFITLAGFSIAAYFHRQVERSITRHKIWLQIKSIHVARIRLDWGNIPSTGGPPF